MARLGMAAALGCDGACCILGHLYQEGRCGVRKVAAEVSFYYAKIPFFTVKHLSAEDSAKAAEWLQANPLRPMSRLAD